MTPDQPAAPADPAQTLDQQTLRIMRSVFLVGGLAVLLLALIDGSSDLLTPCDLWGVPVTSAAYFLSGLLMYLAPQRLTLAILLSFIPTALYQEGILFWAIHFPSQASYYSAASASAFFPVVYIVLFIALPRYANLLSWLHCGLFFAQAVFNWLFFWNIPATPERQAAEHLLFAIVCAQPVYIVSLRYIVTLREQFFRSQQAVFLGKIRFLGMLSHEIKNSLQRMVSAIDLLDLRIRDPEDKKPLARLLSATAHLQSYLRDIAELTRLENPALAIDHRIISLQEFMREIEDDWKPRVAAKELALSIVLPSEPIRLRTDAERLRQVFDNLLVNALNHTLQGGIEISVSTSSATSSGVQFTVQDSGVGIPAEDLARIFDPYVRLAHPDVASSDGSGLGLSIVARIVAALGGSIQVSSTPGQGTRFVLEVGERQ